ncbi:MAG: carbonic anhydrase [Gammaproteobacteria bacterium]|nr:carbonic anhydrase [Gammaproteobacteria bacterium]
MRHTDKLIKGFSRFRHQYYESGSRVIQNLVRDGQAPQTLMIACSDSRVTPSATFDDLSLGEIFMVRNIANLVPPSELDGHLHGTSAAIEFAVEVLRVENIVIKGHSHCGGIRALMTGEGGTYIGPWMNIAATARAEVLRKHADASLDEQTRALERAAMVVSLNNLLTFPSIRTRVTEGTLRLHAWYFDMEEGRLYGYEPQSGDFGLLA